MTNLFRCDHASCPSSSKCYRFQLGKSANKFTTFRAYAPEKGKDRCEHFLSVDPCDQPREEK